MNYEPAHFESELPYLQRDSGLERTKPLPTILLRALQTDRFRRMGERAQYYRRRAGYAPGRGRRECLLVLTYNGEYLGKGSQ